MKVLKFLVRLFFVGTVAAAFFGVPFCWLALKPQRLLWALPLTFLLLPARFLRRCFCGGQHGRQDLHRRHLPAGTARGSGCRYPGL